MQGQTAVIDVLNDVLTGELTSVNQYFIHAKMCKNWGYKKLHEHLHKESIDEMKHADQLIDRILYLDGLPNVQRYNKINVGQTVPEQLKLDLEVERGAIVLLNNGVKLCCDLGDNGTRELLEGILVSEEHHADWLETQLNLVAQVGVENYLAQQM